jgi:hypothetical protein
MQTFITSDIYFRRETMKGYIDPFAWSWSTFFKPRSVCWPDQNQLGTGMRTPEDRDNLHQTQKDNETFNQRQKACRLR